MTLSHKTNTQKLWIRGRAVLFKIKDQMLKANLLFMNEKWFIKPNCKKVFVSYNKQYHLSRGKKTLQNNLVLSEKSIWPH